MSIKVTLYEFRKRDNSTKQPTAEDPHTEWECNLKEDCSLLRPRISINFGCHGNPCFYNYAYIADMGNRYYYITDWVCERGYIWTANLAVDVLASWRYRIGISTQYLERSSFASDGGIVDTLYPAKQPPAIQTVNLASHWYSDLAQGTFVIGVLNNDSSGVGAAHYYAMTQSQMNSFLAFMLGDAGYLAIEDISENLTKAVFNPLQYIVSAVWYPFKIDSGTETTVKFGWWESGVSALKLTRQLYYFTDEITLPAHPQIARGAYLRKAPFTSYTLYYPGVGTIALDTKELDTSPISVQCAVDTVGNQARLVVSTTGSPTHIVSQSFVQLGVPIQLAQFAGDIMGIAQGGASFLKNAISGNLLGAVFDAVGTAISSTAPDATALSQNGSIASIHYAIQLRALFYLLVDEDNADLGRPLCKAVTVNEYPGYQKIIHADVALSGTREESEAVKRYMEEGYFYE